MWHTYTHTVCFLFFKEVAKEKLSAEVQTSKGWASPTNVQQGLHGAGGTAFTYALSQALKHQSRQLVAFYGALCQATYQEENQRLYLPNGIAHPLVLRKNKLKVVPSPRTHINGNISFSKVLKWSYSSKEALADWALSRLPKRRRVGLIVNFIPEMRAHLSIIEPPAPVLHDFVLWW